MSHIFSSEAFYALNGSFNLRYSTSEEILLNPVISSTIGIKNTRL